MRRRQISRLCPATKVKRKKSKHHCRSCHAIPFLALRMSDGTIASPATGLRSTQVDRPTETIGRLFSVTSDGHTVTIVHETC